METAGEAIELLHALREENVVSARWCIQADEFPKEVSRFHVQLQEWRMMFVSTQQLGKQSILSLTLKTLNDSETLLVHGTTVI